nr:MAG TPA: Protein of unknown function (DUF1566) [Caudoviricetes sp.]
MILETKEDFEKATIARKEIKQKVIFYTEEDSELSPIVVDSEEPEIGDLYKNGIYIGSYNGKDVVMALKDEGEYTFDEAMDLEDKRPFSLLEWLLYLENKEIIDKKLKEHGGEPLKDEYYWSSSEYYGHAWYVRPSDGGMSYGNYKDNSRPVRCVLKF